VIVIYDDSKPEKRKKGVIFIREEEFSKFQIKALYEMKLDEIR
jgi:hypothetical protein